MTQERTGAMRRIFLTFLSFGMVAAIVFPFYANFFVNWKEGMLKYFVLGCIVAGIFVGVGNFLVFRSILKALSSRVAATASEVFGDEFARETESSQQAGDALKFIGSAMRDVIDQIQEINEAVNSITKASSKVSETIATFESL